MTGFFGRFFSSDGFMPHGHCYLWQPGVLWLHITSDALITLAYFSIPFTLVYFVRKRKGLEFHWMFLCFATFIVACGTTHLMEIWAIWHPTYWLTGSIKAITALASVPTAILLVKLIPDALAVPSPSALQKANAELEKEVSVRRQAEAEVRRLNEDLERRVSERTEQLEAANRDLKHEIREREHAEGHIRQLNLELERRVAERTAQLENANQKFREHQQELQDYIDSMSTLNAKVALDGTLLLVNRIAQTASGLPMETLLQTNFLEGQWWAFDARVQGRVREAFRNACAGVPVNYDEKLFVFGKVIDINFSLVPVTGPGGGVSYIVAEGRDITSLKRVEQSLAERTAQMEGANKELEAFSYSVSHDLRAPLRGIEGFSRVLLEDYSGALDERGKGYLTRVCAASCRMGQLIDDLLSLSRLSRRGMRSQTVDLSALARTLADELRQSQPDRHVEFVIQPDLKVTGDENLLRVVLVNLLGNAWKFTGRCPQTRIEFGVEPREDASVYFVRDNGAGFDMAYVDKLFGAFQRLHSGVEFEGTGIGLATVQRVIHRHGGRVWAEGEVHKGACFYFTLADGGHRS